MNCLLYELCKRNPGLKFKDSRKLIPIKEGLEFARYYISDGIKFIFNGKNWHANSDFGIPIEEVRFDGLVGEPMSTAMALLYGSMAAGGGAALGGWLGKGEAPEQGYDVVDMPQYPWAEGAQQDVNQYLTGAMESMGRGETPPWMSMFDPMQQGAQQNLSDQFYGTAGRPGNLRDMMGVASQTGVGPKSAMAQGQQLTNDYMSEGRKIDEYFANMKGGMMANQSMQIPQMLMNAPRGPESQIVNMMGGVGGSGGMPNLGSDIATTMSKMPWENMSWGGGGGTQPATSSYGYDQSWNQNVGGSYNSPSNTLGYDPRSLYTPGGGY